MKSALCLGKTEMVGDLLVLDNGVDLGAVLSFDTETYSLSWVEVVTVLSDVVFVYEGELECGYTISRG